jgi:lipase chaperone LimK
VIILLIISYHIFSKDKDLVERNRIDNKQNITLKDNTLSLKPIEYTTHFFKYLEEKFSGICLEERLKKIEGFFYAIMDSKRAEEMFALYKKFDRYENNLIDVTRKWPPPKSTLERIQYLDDLQEYRRNYFGNQLADALFARQVKSQKYHIRKNEIIHDKDLYGAQKEKRLNELAREIWGDGARHIDSDRNPYELYIEKLSMYDKDMGELSEKDKNEKIRSLREQFFPPDAIGLVKKVDERLATKKDRQKLKGDPELTSEKREERND